jgi:hypothetical protein
MYATLVSETVSGKEFIGAMWKTRDANEAWIHP